MEIVFYDVETTIPRFKGDKCHLLEFAGVIVRSEGWVEVRSFATLIQPVSLSAITKRSSACNGIAKEGVAEAPRFEEVADDVFDLLHGRVWAGHNIERFDNLRIREAFESISRPAPEPLGLIDTLPLLRARFGLRAGNLKMATLADYCGLGTYAHRALDDCRMNMQVLQKISTMLLLESHYPALFPSSHKVSKSTSKKQSQVGDSSEVTKPLTKRDLYRSVKVQPEADTSQEPLEVLELKSETFPPYLQPIPVSPDSEASLNKALEDLNLGKGTFRSSLGNETSRSYSSSGSSFSNLPLTTSRHVEVEAPGPKLRGSRKKGKAPAGSADVSTDRSADVSKEVHSGYHEVSADVSTESERKGKGKADVSSSSGVVAVSRKSPSADISTWNIGLSREIAVTVGSAVVSKASWAADVSRSDGVADVSWASGAADVSQLGMLNRVAENADVSRASWGFDVSRESADVSMRKDARRVSGVSDITAESAGQPKTSKRGVSKRTFLSKSFHAPLPTGTEPLKVPSTLNGVADMSNHCTQSADVSNISQGHADVSTPPVFDPPDKLSFDPGAAKALLSKRRTSIHSPPEQGGAQLMQGGRRYPKGGVQILQGGVERGVNFEQDSNFLTMPSPSHRFLSAHAPTHLPVTRGTQLLNTSQTSLQAALTQVALSSRHLAPPLPAGTRLNPPNFLEGLPGVTPSTGVAEKASPAEVAKSYPPGWLPAGTPPSLAPLPAGGEPTLTSAVDLREVEVLEERSTWGGSRVVLLYQGGPIQVQEKAARLRYSVGSTYAFDSSGKPTFSVVLEPSAQAVALVQHCDALVQASLSSSRSSSTFRPTLIAKAGEPSAFRVRISTLGIGNDATYTTRFFRKSSSGVLEVMPLRYVEPSAFRSSFPVRSRVDVVLSIESYEFHGYAGVRLVASILTLL